MGRGGRDLRFENITFERFINLTLLGMVERANRTIIQKVAKKMEDYSTQWVRYLQWIEFSMNSCIHPSTHNSPFALMFGRQPRIPIKNLYRWVPRDLNKQADTISRLPEVLDTDDWGITDEFYLILNRRWGPFTIDCFANMDKICTEHTNTCKSIERICG